MHQGRVRGSGDVHRRTGRLARRCPRPAQRGKIQVTCSWFGIVQSETWNHKTLETLGLIALRCHHIHPSFLLYDLDSTLQLSIPFNASRLKNIHVLDLHFLKFWKHHFNHISNILTPKNSMSFKWSNLKSYLVYLNILHGQHRLLRYSGRSGIYHLWGINPIFSQFFQSLIVNKDTCAWTNLGVTPACTPPLDRNVCMEFENQLTKYRIGTIPTEILDPPLSYLNKIFERCCLILTTMDINGRHFKNLINLKVHSKTI